MSKKDPLKKRRKRRKENARHRKWMERRLARSGFSPHGFMSTGNTKGKEMTKDTTADTNRFITIANDGALIKSTNYWTSNYAMAGKCWFSVNAGCIRLLLSGRETPPLDDEVLDGARYVIVTRGKSEGKDAYEVLFEDMSSCPFVIFTLANQWDRLLPHSDSGRTDIAFHVYKDGRLVRKTTARFRIVSSLPCLRRGSEARANAIHEDSAQARTLDETKTGGDQIMSKKDPRRKQEKRRKKESRREAWMKKQVARGIVVSDIAASTGNVEGESIMSSEHTERLDGAVRLHRLLNKLAEAEVGDGPINSLASAMMARRWRTGTV